jgi:cell wall-associated NlpC family hydrolase
MQRSPTSSRSGGSGRPPRRAARRAIGCCLITLVLLATQVSAAGAAEPGEGGPHPRAALEALGDTVLAALATSPAGDSLADSIAMLEARFRVQARLRSAGATAPGPRMMREDASDPSSIPPASAGSNGTPHSPAPGLNGEQIFAHTRNSADPGSTAILLTGVALAPPQAPEAIKGVINAANTIIGRPYIWGGGHQSFYSNGYDCSGSVSFALFGGGLIPRPLTSSELEHWGAPGPGKWVTIYANAGHTFAEIAGLRWDTVGDEKGTGPRWHLAPTSPAGFVARHPPGF